MHIKSLDSGVLHVIDTGLTEIWNKLKIIQMSLKKMKKLIDLKKKNTYLQPPTSESSINCIFIKSIKISHASKLQISFVFVFFSIGSHWRFGQIPHVGFYRYGFE